MPGVRISDVLSPLSPSDTYPVVDVDVNAKGFARAVSSIAQRDAIPTSLRSTSLFVLVTDTAQVFRWTGSAWLSIGYLVSSPSFKTQVWNEVPVGAIDGSNAKFTLAGTPNPSNSLLVFRNGLLMRAGVGNDYTLTGTEIQFESGNIPQTGDSLVCSYSE